MSTPRKYVHIGFPKSASTSLQNFYFAVHPDCYHLGLGYQSKGNRYIDDNVEMVSEIDVRLKKQFLYDADVSRARLEPHFAEAAKQNFKAVGLSNEFFSFALGNEVDTYEKAVRLRGLLGEDAVVVIVIREQFSMLKSLYLELITGGYPGTYRKYLEYTLLYQVRSWCLDFCYDKIFETYANLFGTDNVCMVPFELLRKDSSEFLGTISGKMGIDHSVTEMRSVNQAKETLGFYEQLRRYNEKFPHEFGSLFFEPFNMNRMRSYFHNELGLAVPHDRLADDFVRGSMMQAATKFSQISLLPDISLSIPSAIDAELDKIYRPSNNRLQKLSGLDLSEYGYRL